MPDFNALDFLSKHLNEFIEKLTIITKGGKKAFLNLNEEQEEIIAQLNTGKSVIILKPRQVGASTGISAWLFAKAFTSVHPITIVVLTHKSDATKQIMRMHHTYYNSLPAEVQALNKLQINNQLELKFETGARILGMSARADGTTRSFTAEMVHISEFAFAKEPEELLAAATSAVNDGTLIYESTANFPGDALDTEIGKYLNKEHSHHDWSFLFFAWYKHSSYQKTTPGDWRTTEEEQELKRRFELTDEQLCWRRAKIAQTNKAKFVREYPATVEEAYQTTGSTLLEYADFQELTIVQTYDGQQWVTYAEPQEDDEYALGADAAAGVGRDKSAFVIMSKKTNQVVLQFRSNTIKPEDFAEYILNAAIRYNKAVVLVEAMTQGLVVLNELRHSGYAHIWKDEKGRDFATNASNKIMIFEDLAKDIRSKRINVLDSETVSDLRAIIIDENGLVKFGHNGKSHCDNAMALALANLALKKVRLKTDSFLPGWLKTRRSKSIKQETGAAIAQHRRY